MVALLDLVLVKNIDRDFRSSRIAEPFPTRLILKHRFLRGNFHLRVYSYFANSTDAPLCQRGEWKLHFHRGGEDLPSSPFFLPRHASCETRERRSRRFYFKITFFPLWFYHLAPDISPLICGCILKHQSGDSSVCWEEYLRAFIRTITYIRAINVCFEIDI